jgi:hypothetical protein
MGSLLVQAPEHFLSSQIRQAQIKEHEIVGIAQRDAQALVPPGSLVDGEPG